jgi:hypothetical protein
VRVVRGRRLRWGSVVCPLCLVALGCDGTLNAGDDRPMGLLLVDERNPMILCNDGHTDNWQGEYAFVLSHAKGLSILGLLVSQGGIWNDVDANVAGWSDMVAAARSSGLSGIPDPIASPSESLVRPSDGMIDSTVPNDSAGARFIVNASLTYATPERPVVVATGGRLTDVADAYLLDHDVADRIVVISSLGAVTDLGAEMANPNGEMDYWADVIVSARLPYIQVSAFYDQTQDVPAARTADLPSNAFGDWMSAKQSSILDLDEASDQVSVLAAAVAPFATQVQRVSQEYVERATESPPPATLVKDSAGTSLVVTKIDVEMAPRILWEGLADL